MLVNYRGYGDSPGSPSVKAIKQDSLNVLDWLSETQGISTQNIVIMGRSLGSGFAVWVASQRQVKAVVLVSPFDTLTAVGQHHYPWLPVKWLLRQNMEPQQWAKNIDRPSLILVGDRDRIIPNQHSEKVRDALAGTVEWISIAGADHNSLESYETYWIGLHRFLDDLD